MSDIFAPIPKPNPEYDFSLEGVSINPENSPFIKITESDRIIIVMQYALHGIPQATTNCYLRQSVYYKLMRAAENLPIGFKFKIYDAWRPLAVQKYLYNVLGDKIKKKYDHLPACELEKVIKTFVSPPSEDIYYPPVHTTGGAVDLTIIDDSGLELNMGTEFDEFDKSSHTSFFECEDELSLSSIAINRRMLYNIMIKEGFTNLPTEWWHYDFGNNFWSFYTNKPSKYIGVFQEDQLFQESEH